MTLARWYAICFYVFINAPLIWSFIGSPYGDSHCNDAPAKSSLAV